jgi:hypothetical protein
MSEPVSCAEVENIVTTRFVERDKLISAFGCQTLVGCGKTKEIEARYGKIQSDINDLGVTIKKSLEILEGMKREISGMKSVLVFDEQDMTTKMEKMGTKIKKENRALIGAAFSIIVVLFGAKLFQDYKNQEQTIGFLKPMLESIAVLQDHDKVFTEHVKGSR